MWYQEHSNSLQMDKPIMTTDGSGDPYLLLPQIERGSYTIRGYNWFNIRIGTYNSSCFFKSAEEAIKQYSSYKIYNVDITLQRR